MTTYYIYKIYCNDDNVTDTYIGSTKNIATRKYQHKCKCNNPNDRHYNLKVYKMIRENGGWDNFTFVIIEEIKECSKIQAHIREEYHRKQLKANMNSVSCFSGAVDYNSIEEYNKQYYEINRDKILENEKKWRGNNLDKFREYQKQYREDNKERKKEADKQYQQDNKEQINIKRSIKTLCECSGTYTLSNKAIHFKSKKHQTYLADLKSIEPNV